jgi:hypothetical protein
MKINELSSFPYPVLSPWSDDITGANFSTEIKFREDKESNQVSIHFAATLSHPQIETLIKEGQATFGCYIKCIETGLRRLIPLSFPNGVHHFSPGAMLGNVYIRPMIWSVAQIVKYKPKGLHPEFENTFDLGSGAIIAIDEEQVIEVTRPPLPNVESYFEIKSSEELLEGDFELDLESNSVVVRMGPSTFKLVQGLRHTDEATRTVLMNSLYVQVVMQVLYELSISGKEPYEQYRWLYPFSLKCESLGINLEEYSGITGAQKLLGQPFARLSGFINTEEGADHANS